MKTTETFKLEFSTFFSMDKGEFTMEPENLAGKQENFTLNWRI